MRLVFLLALFWSASLHAIEVVDDTGSTIQLNKPAQRIISLAPHVTELLFEAGAGQNIIGVVQYSNYPDAAKQIPRVGGYQKLDMERIVSMQPDLIIGWQTGNRKSELDKLKQLGLKVFLTEPRQVPDIASLLERLGILTGSEVSARQASARFLHRYQLLKKRYQDKKSLRAFYLIWDQPLMTVNGQHLISDVMRLCALENVFADTSTLVPRIDLESVLEADPQLIIAGGISKLRPGWASKWKHWPDLSATHLNAFFDINPDIIQRHSHRILQGAEQLCQQAEQLRQRIEE